MAIFDNKTGERLDDPSNENVIVRKAGEPVTEATAPEAPPEPTQVADKADTKKKG